jgi:purine nucleoside permease
MLRKSLIGTLGLTGLLGGFIAASPAYAAQAPIAPKVMIISMFGPEAKTWIEKLKLDQPVAVEGLSGEYPNVLCNEARVCLMTTAMGQTNAAASTMALTFSPKFDLRKTYFLIAGIAGISPHEGTIGTTAWAHYLVNFGIQWELDAREAPADWKGGYLGINTRHPSEKPPLDYKTEVFEVNQALQDKAYALSKDVQLVESTESAAWRKHYSYAPANQPPKVTRCDTLAGDTWFSGTLLSQRAEEWTRILTDGKGRYCTTQQEDNATYEALLRASRTGRVDVQRLAVVRAGSDFDRPYEGYKDVDNLIDYAKQGGFEPALENLYRTGNPLVQDIVKNWSAWEKGVPSS